MFTRGGQSPTVSRGSKPERFNHCSNKLVDAPPAVRRVLRKLHRTSDSPGRLWDVDKTPRLFKGASILQLAEEPVAKLYDLVLGWRRQYCRGRHSRRDSIHVQPEPEPSPSQPPLRRDCKPHKVPTSKRMIPRHCHHRHQQSFPPWRPPSR